MGQLIISEWSDHNKFAEANLKKWWSRLNADTSKEQVISELFLLIAYMKFTLNMEEYNEYMPRIIKALVKARNWYLINETNTFVTDQVYLNPKNKSNFLLVNYKKQLNESFNENANFGKKVRISTEASAKSKEQTGVRPGRKATRTSVVVSNEKLN